MVGRSDEPSRQRARQGERRTLAGLGGDLTCAYF